MSYQVKIQPSNLTINVDNEESILSAALRQGVNLPYGCRSGNCGSCKSLLVEGEINYPFEQALSLSDEEKQHGMVLLCQAQPQSDLVIEAQVLPAD